MYRQQRWLHCEQREGGKSYISWRTSEPFKEVVVGVFFVFLSFSLLLVLNYVAWTCYGVEQKKRFQRELRRVSGLHWFLLLCVDTGCCFCCCFCRRCVRDTRQTRTYKLGDGGKHPLRPACQTWATRFFRKTPLKTSIAYIRVISTHFIRLEHIWSHVTNQISNGIA